MAKKFYRSPILMISVDDDPTIIIGGSQGTSGIDSRYTFTGIDEDTMSMIELNCDDFDFQDMDTDDNFVITQEEFDAWYAANQPW